MTPFIRSAYFRGCLAVAIASVLASGMCACTGALKFGDAEEDVQVTMTLAQDGENRCWEGAFVVEGGALPAEIDPESVVDAITIEDAGGTEVEPVVRIDGEQVSVCGALRFCTDYTISFVDGVISYADGNPVLLTLPTANLSMEMPDNPGDYDGDCFADFLTGDYAANTNDGLARFYYGNEDPAGGMDFAAPLVPENNGRFGFVVLMTDDMGVTAAGGNNILISARTSSEGAIPSVGRVFLETLDGLLLEELLNVRGTIAEERMGFRMGFLGDVNDDGYGDFAATGRGNPGDPAEGQEAYIFLGPWVADKTSADADGKLRNDYDPDPITHANGSYWIEGNHDFDGDGIDDAFVSGFTVELADPSTAQWKIFFYKGGQAFSGDIAPDSYVWGGGTDYNGFGYIFDLGDFNGDGNADLIAAAIDAEITSLAPLEITVNYGAVFVFFGPRAMDAPLTYEDADVMISADDEIMGFQVANAGDVNGDGIQDVIVTSLIAPNVPGYPDAHAYIYLGRQSWEQEYGKGDADLVISGLSALTETVDDTIYAGAGIGDIDNDGRDDFAVGAVEKASGQASIYVFMGEADFSGQTFYFTDAVQKIDSPDPASDTGMSSAGGIWGMFVESQYPLDDYIPDPEKPPGQGDRQPGT